MKKKKQKKEKDAYMGMLDKNNGKWMNRLLIATPTRGLVRMEWVNGRYGQVIPTNWSHVDVQQWLSPYIPTKYQLVDAENLIAKIVVEKDFEWFLSIEDDNVLPPGALIKINQYIIKGDVPVVSGLYFTKSVPPEPILYRGQGTGFYADWKMGDKVWVDGIPFGFTLIHGSIIKKLWEESEEYSVNGVITRRVFNVKAETVVDPETGGFMNNMGTSDLAWCKRLIDDKIFEKAGWPTFQKKKYPFLVDTGIFIKHVDQDGVLWPTMLPKPFLDGEKSWKQCMTP